MIGASRSQNTSDTSSRKEYKKESSDKPVHDEEDDAIVSHQKSVFLVQSYLVQEEGQTKIVASPALKIIGNSCSHNTSYTSSRKECEKDSADKPVHDEGDGAVVSHQKSMFLVQSHLSQE